jgi:hypothetical protein
MIKVFAILALVFLTSCVPFKQQEVVEQVVSIPTVDIPAPLQSTTSVTQYDYKAGAPDVFTEQPPIEPSAPNPYLIHEQYQPLPDYFKPLKPAVPTTYWIPRWN